MVMHGSVHSLTVGVVAAAVKRCVSAQPFLLQRDIFSDKYFSPGVWVTPRTMSRMIE